MTLSPTIALILLLTILSRQTADDRSKWGAMLLLDYFLPSRPCLRDQSGFVRRLVRFRAASRLRTTSLLVSIRYRTLVTYLPTCLPK